MLKTILSPASSFTISAAWFRMFVFRPGSEVDSPTSFRHLSMNAGRSLAEVLTVSSSFTSKSVKVDDWLRLAAVEIRLSRRSLLIWQVFATFLKLSSPLLVYAKFTSKPSENTFMIKFMSNSFIALRILPSSSCSLSIAKKTSFEKATTFVDSSSDLPLFREP